MLSVLARSAIAEQVVSNSQSRSCRTLPPVTPPADVTRQCSHPNWNWIKAWYLYYRQYRGIPVCYRWGLCLIPGRYYRSLWFVQRLAQRVCRVTVASVGLHIKLILWEITSTTPERYKKDKLIGQTRDLRCSRALECAPHHGIRSRCSGWSFQRTGRGQTLWYILTARTVKD